MVNTKTHQNSKFDLSYHPNSLIVQTIVRRTLNGKGYYQIVVPKIDSIKSSIFRWDGGAGGSSRKGGSEYWNWYVK